MRKILNSGGVRQEEEGLQQKDYSWMENPMKWFRSKPIIQLEILCKGEVPWFSQKIFRDRPFWPLVSVLFGRGIELYELFIQFVIQGQDRGQIPTSIAIVRSRPNCHQLLLEHLLVSLHYQLMGSTYQICSILMIKFINHLHAKSVSSSSLIDCILLYIFWVKNLLPSGSDHIRSLMGPSWGISCRRSIVLISSIELWIAGLIPPWTQNIFSSTTAARQMKSKASVQYFHTLREPYFLKHSS